MHHELLELLLALHGVEQPLRYHPEGDALYHSLQVFDLARRESDDPVLWASALFHDVGKSVGGSEHDAIGADLLEGLFCPRIAWLVRHHLDLLREPRRTRRKLLGSRELVDLERLRRWDLGGRQRHAHVLSAEEALDVLLASSNHERIFDGAIE